MDTILNLLRLVPTDKISKFLVFAGLVLAPSGMLVSEMYVPRLRDEFEKIEDQQQHVMQEEQKLMFAGMPMNEVDALLGDMLRRDHIEDPPATDGEKEELRQLGESLKARVLRRSTVPFQEDEKAKAYWTHALHVSGADYDLMCTHLDEVNQLTVTIKKNQELLPEVEQMFSRQQRQWVLKSKYGRAECFTLLAPFCGIAMLILGVIWWWRDEEKQAALPAYAKPITLQAKKPAARKKKPKAKSTRRRGR